MKNMMVGKKIPLWKPQWWFSGCECILGACPHWTSHTFHHHKIELTRRWVYRGSFTCLVKILFLVPVGMISVGKTANLFTRLAQSQTLRTISQPLLEFYFRKLALATVDTTSVKICFLIKLEAIHFHYKGRKEGEYKIKVCSISL